MIVSKPKFSTLFSLIIFLVLAYGLSAYLLLNILGKSEFSLWITIFLGISLVAALAVTYKTIAGYKKMEVSQNRIDIHFAFNLVKRRYYFKDLLYWQETVVKSAFGLFKELTLHFESGGKVRLSIQEHDNYEKVRSFMKRKFSKKQQK